MTGGNGISSTNSSQQLMNADTDSVTASGSVISSIDGEDGGIDVTKRPSSQNSHQYNGIASITYSEWFAVGVLCFVNLINYMDRFTIAGKYYFYLFFLAILIVNWFLFCCYALVSMTIVWSTHIWQINHIIRIMCEGCHQTRKKNWLRFNEEIDSEVVRDIHRAYLAQQNWRIWNQCCIVIN